MTTLILGSSGPIGTATAKALQATGKPYLAVSRNASGPHTAAADRNDTAEILRLMAQHKVTTLIDVIAYTEADTLPLLTAIDGKIARYVMLSSADVYRNYGLLNRNETGEPARILTEDAPLRTSPYPYRLAEPRAGDAPDKWMDDYDKIPLEAAARVMQSDVTILRLPMVYGPAAKLDRFSWITSPMRANVAELNVAADWYRWTTTYAHVDNIAAAIMHAAHHPNAANETFNIIDHPAIPHSEWITAYAEALNWPGHIKLTDAPDGGTSGLDLDVPLNMNGGLFFRRTGFTPPLARLLV